MIEPFHIVFALFPNLTQLDFTGPFEVLWRLPGSRVTVASRQGGELTSDSGLTFGGLTKLADIPSCDLFCVPGGSGLTEALLDEEYMSEVRRLGQSARYLTSVCSGSLILAAAGLIDGKRAACHWNWRELLGENGVTADERRVVRDGQLITGGGVTAGIDFALTVVGELAGAEVAQAIQLAIEYAPIPPFDAGRPETAPPAVLRQVQGWSDGRRAERRAAMQTARARVASALRR
jgi:transcriptional regulator GlxA family with amidase domain